MTRACPICGGPVPRVVGAETDVCARCGAEVPSPSPPPGPPPRPRRDTAAAAVRAFRAVTQNYGGWLVLYLPLVLVVAAVDTAATGALVAMGVDPEAPAVPATLAVVVAIALPTLVLELGLVLAFAGVGAAVTARAVREGRRPTLRDSAQVLARRLGPLLGAGFVLAAVLLAGVVLLIVPAVIFLHRYLWTTAFVAEGRRPAEAFTASRALAAEPGLRAYTLLVALAFTGALLLASALWGAVGPRVEARPLLAGVAAGAVAWLVTPLVPALMGSLLATATASTGAPATTADAPAAPYARPAPPPAPRRVRCPGCATEFDVPTGEGPQRVQCPTCGRAGVVR